ncbi:platelet binding protein GspB isoform X10 [Drosophila bipectinata]|uniref:platelet binding protein GspB isoform X10 n=1 Tax=Drosophila bipectinata TaxID=42026 RepID=UPI001C8A1DF4|nr:serine-rich adhesin for platelets isoform X7 [Drosophila bipectinata]
MDLSLERDSSALGSLFQQIINDMKNTSPLWEDFVAKAGKLHTCLRAAIQAIAAYLDAFQKIADAATNSRGASKEIGTALTRVCLRHKAVETRLKTFTTAIMDCLVQPLQERIEDWKRTVATIDKDHAKEYKRCRSELKKRSSDTLRLQKKARKGQTDGLQSLMDSHMQDVTLRRAELEEVEKKSLRAAMVEERLRYCSFVHMLQPVVHEECEVMSELGHLQEAMQSIALVTKDPSVLPQASEELIHDAKASINLYPESPGGGSGSQGGGCSNSLGSRKSSVCSISSINSSGSSNSPGHHHYPRSLSQFVTPAIRLKPGESSDSGFCSSPALTTQTSNATNQTANVSTWPPHTQDAVDSLPPTADRPHTISTAYEKGHQRPPLTVYTFQNPETIPESTTGLNNGQPPANGQPSSGQTTPATQKSPAASLSRPPLPVRCSSLERPLSAQSNHRQGSGSNLLQRQCPSPIPAHITKELSAAHHAQQQQHQQLQQQQQPQPTPPTYVNMSELANMAAMKLTNHQNQNQNQQQPPPLKQQSSIDSISSQHSNDSTGSHQLLQQQQQHQHMPQQPNHHSASATATRSHSISSTASSLHSHPSIDSTVACGSLVGQHNHSTSTNTNTTTTSPSSGCSTPQNHYSPLLTNSPTSTAAGTPSGSSIGTGAGLGFVYQVSSPTPPSSEVLKITEQGTGSGQASVNTDGEEETDERSRASVLQKASMFEKAAAAAAVSPPAPAPVAAPTASVVGPAGGRRSEAEQQEMDKSFEDSIQALNNLIGELDSFQREIDEGKGKQMMMMTSNNNMSTMTTTSSSSSSTDNNNTPAGNTSTIEPCAISNQTHSSGCGTDISDTTSDELGGDESAEARRRDRDRDRDRDLLGASDSELSRCYVSETSSLTGGMTAGGYENPTFAHFVAASAGREEAGPGDSVSLASDSLCLGQTRHAYVDTCSDNGSGVVVIYDHQIPITPDIEFVKQNSEIVLLRTKDPQPQALQLHEMRELQQLPTNLAGTPDSSPDGQAPPQPSTATVAPAKQRLSSFRATSEQQLQLLGRGSPQRGKTATTEQAQDQHPPPPPPQQQPVDPVKRQLPPKPTSLSLFSGPAPSLAPGDKPLVPRKSDFKADLDAKIRRQKQKVQQQLQQQSPPQQQAPSSATQPQQQQHSPPPPPPQLQSPPNRNCNVTNKPAANVTASASASGSKLNQIHRNPSQNQTAASSNHPNKQYKTPPAACPAYSSSSTSLPSLPLSVSTTSSSANSPPSMLPASARPVHTPPHVHSNANANATANAPANPQSPASAHANVKPCITPRPASLSGGAGGGGGSTRIARRSSINQAKPPPPVRRSSSVTPSPNASVGTFRTSSPAAGGGGGIYAQPKLVNSMSSFRTSSPSPNGHAHPLPPTQPKANPNLIAQLNARLNSKQQHQPQHQQHEGIYGNQHQQQQQQPGGDSIYMRGGLSMSQTPQQQHFDGKSEQQMQHQQHRIYASYGTSSSQVATSVSASVSVSVTGNSSGSNAQPSILTPTSSSSFNALPHFPLSSSTSSLLSKVSSFSNASSSPPTAGGSANNSHYQPPQPPTASSGGTDYGSYSSSFTKNSAAAQMSNMRQVHPHQHQPQQQHYTCPPPLEDPPPPPIYSAGSSATMPKKMARPHAGHAPHASAYAAASATATLPKNIMQQQQQQRLLQQQQAQQQQHQQQQYQQPTGMGNGNGHGHVSHRPQLPLPQQKMRAAQQQQQHLAEQQQQHQPPIPSRHSSVQQKIFVSTNPFIQTTAVKFHSPSASPICGSPGSGSGSMASIYATTARGSHQQHQQQQQQQQHYYRDAAGGNSNGGAGYYNHNAHGHAHAHSNAHAHAHANAHAHAQAHHANYATSTNIEKTGSIRAKTKAEFLENLNAKLAKQGMSGRAFAVRNLINSKALMYQNPQSLSRPSAQYRRPPTYPNTSNTINTINTCDDDQC